MNIKNELKKILKNKFKIKSNELKKIKNINENNFYNFENFDSFSFVELISKLEKKFKILFKKNIINKNLTINTLTNLIENKNYKKLSKSDEKKLLMFVNNTIKTNFRYNSKRSDFSKVAFNSHSKWDSLAHAKLLSALEKKYKISINKKNINQFSNLKLIIKYLNKQKVQI